MNRSLARRAVLLLITVIPLAAAGAEAPRTVPEHDADISYAIPTPAGAAMQRLRYNAALRLLRIDPPGDGLHVVIDNARGRMVTVRAADRSLIDMPAPAAWMPGIGAAGYVRGRDDVVAGLPCTEWRTRDSEGRGVRACFTADGMLLRAVTEAGQVLLLAVDVRRAAQDPALFAIPAGYRRLAPPPLPGMR
jgi:hypothetical protein